MTIQGKPRADKVERPIDELYIVISESDNSAWFPQTLEEIEDTFSELSIEEGFDIKSFKVFKTDGVGLSLTISVKE